MNQTKFKYNYCNQFIPSSYSYKDPLFSMGKVRVMFPICSTAIRQHNVPPSLLKGGVEMEVFSFRPSLYDELFSAHAETTCLKIRLIHLRQRDGVTCLSAVVCFGSRKQWAQHRSVEQSNSVMVHLPFTKR